MRRWILLLAFVCIFIPVFSYAQTVQEMWTARYNGTGNNYDEANAITVDQYGNVYVTGESRGSSGGPDYVTVKYNPNGILLWSVRYNGPGNSDDRAVAIAVDNNGNVYVTGESKGSGSNLDYATIKYDTNGNQLWIARYNGPANCEDIAHGIALDGSGNIYVTGESKGNNTGYDYATVKYNANGNQVWVKRYNGPVSYQDTANAIAVDVNGNVYVTGESKGSGSCLDFATVKYDTNGNELWVKRSDNPSNYHDSAYAIAVDGSGNVYVTGKSKISTYHYDYTTVKYDTNGNEKWTKRYNGPGNGDDAAYAIAVDGVGNVYVAGESTGSGWTGADYATIKYDANGNVVWIARYNGPGNRDDSAYAIALDGTGNVYVTGKSEGYGTDEDYATIKYNAAGNQVWVVRYNGPVNEDDSANAMAVDDRGYVYVTGKSEGSGRNDDYLTIKYGDLKANFSGTPTSGYSPLTVQFTDASTGNITNWSWNFGDGGTSISQNPSHVYNTSGTFTVTLTVTGPGGSTTETKTNYNIVVTEAPPVANFSGTPATGYRPLTVQFTDGSTGNITSRSWTFGDSGTSTAQNPSHAYTTTGTFTVSLTVTGPGGSDIETKTGYIVVTEAAPVANFSGTPATGYRPLTVQFTDGSTGNITSRSWTFGDGGTSTAQNPSHAYTTTGTFTVSLTVTGPGGSDIETKTGYIVVTEAPPVANFSGTPTTGNRPLTVQFTDASTGNITSRSWTFGDGGTSTAQNPSHAYNATGTYTVSLTVTGPGGSDTETKTGYIVVTEAPPVANFSGTPATGYRPLTVQFTDGSTGSITSRSWTFGDGGTSTAQNPSHAYTTTGTFTVSLTVTGPGGSDIETKTGYIVVTEAPPVANFGGNPTSGYSPLTVQFADVSAGIITSWSWNFGDGGTSTAQNPSHTYNSAGIFTVTLTVTGPGGTDTETKTGYINVNEATKANFIGMPTNGYRPLTVHFIDSSTGSVTVWSWDFGDGGTSTAQNPSHTYTTTGTFTVSLTVTGLGGTDTETKTDYIQVSEAPPEAGFSGTPTTGYRPLTVQFIDGSTGNITSRSWSFGDSGTSTAQNPSHTYNATGTYTVSLTVTGPGGSDTETKTGYIVVIEAPPVANFNGTPTSGYRPLTVQFTDGSTGNITGWSWSFGDSGTSTAQNPSHTYNATGTYTVSLIVTGPGGTDTETKSGYITVSEAPPVADFSGTPTTGYRPLTVQFTDASTGNITSRSWSFGDGGTSTAQNPSHTYNATGTYTVSLTVTGPGGADTETKTGYIVVIEAPPVANFNGTPTTGYRPLTVEFTDGSTGTITCRSWSFGDSGTSTAQNPSHTYNATGTYTVSLTVTGPGGSDTETKTGYIHISSAPPLAGFSVNKTSGYKPLIVQFTDESTGDITGWSWNFGDSGTSTAQNPSHTYSSVGCFDVSLTVTGPEGVDPLTKVNYICASEAPPVAGFSANITLGNRPLLVLFSDHSTGNITTWLWDFGDGSTSTDQNPSHTYTATGDFTVTLTVTGPGGTDPEVKTGYISVHECTIKVPKDYPTIQKAIDAADNGCTILVSSGIYTENINFRGKAIRVIGVGTSASCGCSTEGLSKVAISGGHVEGAVTFNAGETRSSILENFTIIYGLALRGGGIFIEDASPTIIDCYIVQNLAYEDALVGNGGGIYVTGSSASPLIFNSLITGNSARSDGGQSAGGGIYVTGGANPTIQNCTIASNESSVVGGGGIHITDGSSAHIVDSIIWGNSPKDLNCEGGCLDVTYSDIGEVVAGTGNISKEPAFVAGTLGSFYLGHVSAGQENDSPCVDSGSILARNIGLDTRNTASNGNTDRVMVDMGYHYAPAPVYITAASPSGTTFTRGQQVTHTITYGIEGNPGTLYEVTGKVIVTGSFKKTYSKKETHNPGVYTMQIKKSIPSTAQLRKANITYKVILKKAGTTGIIGTDKEKSSMTIQ
jgi:uncharacterized delta-60 repeat protein